MNKVLALQQLDVADVKDAFFASSGSIVTDGEGFDTTCSINC